MTERTPKALAEPSLWRHDQSIRGWDEYKGKRLADVRVFYKSETGGEPQPTKKGICVRVETLPDLIAALEKAVREAHEAGFTNEEKRDAA